MIDLTRYPLFLAIFTQRLELQRELAALATHNSENDFLLSTTKKGLKLLENYKFVTLAPVEQP